MQSAAGVRTSDSQNNRIETHLAHRGSPKEGLTECSQGHLTALEADRPPNSYLERLILKQAARHAAALDLAHQAEADVVGANESAGATLGILLSPAMKGVLEFQNRHERGLMNAVAGLQRVERWRETPDPPRLFADELACRRYLLRWQQAQQWQCPGCGCDQRFWLSSRPRFECRCGRQFPVAVGTIFAGSHLPLASWFTTIVHCVFGSHSATTISRELRLSRPQTVRALIRKVNDALASVDADQRLAGVNLVALAHLPKAPCAGQQMEGEHLPLPAADLSQPTGFTKAASPRPR